MVCRNKSLLTLLALCTLVSSGCKTLDQVSENKELSASVSPNKQELTLAEVLDLALHAHRDAALNRFQEAITSARVAALKREINPDNFSAMAGYPSGQVTTFLQGQGDPPPVDSFALAWNNLDFGVAFVQASIWEEDRVIGLQKMRSEINTIIQAVLLYWQARMADEMIPVADELFKQVRGEGDKLITSGSSDHNAYRHLTEISSKIIQMKEFLTNRKRELAQHIKAPLNSPPRLSGPAQVEVILDMHALPPIIMLEKYVIAHRPGLHEPDAKESLSLGRTRLALMRLLPGLERRFHPRREPGDRAAPAMGWDLAGTLLAKRLMTWFSASTSGRHSVNNSQEMAGTRRLALQMTGVMQTHLALESLYFAQARYQSFGKGEVGKGGIRPESFVRGTDSGVTVSEFLNSRMERLITGIHRGLAYAQAQMAMTRLQATLGVDLRSEQALSGKLTATLRDVVDWRESPVEKKNPASPPKTAEAPPPAPSPATPPPPAESANAPVQPMEPPPMEPSPMEQQPPPATLDFQNSQPRAAGPSYYLTPDGKLVPTEPNTAPGAMPPTPLPADQPDQSIQPQRPMAPQQPPQQQEQPQPPPTILPPATLDFTGSKNPPSSPPGGTPGATPGAVLDFTGGGR